MLMDTLRFVPNVVFTSGVGACLYDTEGREWLDFFADVGTASLGYSPEEARAALGLMLRQSIPIHAPNLYRFACRERAAERLCRATNMDRVFFCNSGTESVEAAIKIARLKRYQQTGNRTPLIVSMAGSFHGRTYGALAAGDGPRHHYEGFGELPPHFMHVKSFRDIPSYACAVILAPVFGNNDIREYDPAELRWLREFTSEHDIALIFDEVQTGSGRTGGMTYGQTIGVTPDIICLAKGVAMGAPVGACLARGTYATAITPGAHFSTFGGNPFSSVMVNAMLDWLHEDDADGTSNFMNVSRKGDRMKATLSEMGFQNVRGPGMLIAFDHPGDSLELAAACRDERLIIGAFRAGPGPIKVTPPLNITDHELDRGLAKLQKAAKSCS